MATFVPTPVSPTLNIVFAVDATGSMSSTLLALRPALVQVFTLMPLFAPDAKFSLLIYRDFDQPEGQRYSFHGPYSSADAAKLVGVLANTQANGGGDVEECQKYAFNLLLREDVCKGKTVVYHFTDAPPHPCPFLATAGASNHYLEGTVLTRNKMQKDWVRLCEDLRSHAMVVYTIGHIYKLGITKYYAAMGDITGGEMVCANSESTDTLLRITIKILARSLGYDECDLTDLASLHRVRPGQRSLQTEDDLFDLDGGAKMDWLQFTANEAPTVRTAGCDVAVRKNIESRYKTDPAFQVMCYEVFRKLLNDGQIRSLTYNPILGCLYRCMNRRSKVAKTEELRTELNALVSGTMQRLKALQPAHYNEVAKWIEESYNRVDEINEMLGAVDNPVPFFVLQTPARMTKKDLSLACKIPLPHALRQIGEMVSSISVVNTMPKVMPEVYVPLAVDDATLFSLISHLMCPGVRLDFKPSVIVAFVALMRNVPYLADRAKRFLIASRGTWFDRTAAEWHLFGFIKMVLSVNEMCIRVPNPDGVEHVLTTDEVAYLTPFYNIAVIKYNNPLIDVETRFRLKPEHKKLYPDHKAKCSKCGQFRSLSVMTPDGVCGLCLSYSPHELAALGDVDEKKSYIFECGRCSSIYAVRNIDNLVSKPKCHYCRKQPPTYILDIPKVACEVCGIGLILPARKIDSTAYQCALCVENDNVPRVSKNQVRLHALLETNPWLIECLLGLTIPVEKLTSQESLFQCAGSFETVTGRSCPIRTIVYAGDGLPILNQSIVLNTLLSLKARGNVGTEECGMCFKDFIYNELDRVCFNDGCNMMSCKECIRKWFSENGPGKRVIEGRLQCPSCKCYPVGGLAFMAQPELYGVLSKKLVFDYDWHYAWCGGCNKIKPYMQRQCAGPDPLEVRGYQCEECMKPGDAKSCPFCGIPTTKMDGCDHMECPTKLGGCGTHWCYRCEGPSFYSKDSKDVYDHLHDVHRNIWGQDDD